MKLLKVVLEFEDKIQTLEGKDAQKWIESVNGMCIMGHIHGIPFPTFAWETKKKKKLFLNRKI